MAGEPFLATRIISLGGRCATAYNLRRFFGFEEAFPFDWWVSPAAGVAALLRNPDPNWLYDPTKLELIREEKTVRHTELGLLLHHEFPRWHDRPGHPVQANFRGAIEEPKQRTTYLLRKLRDLDRADERLLFVRECEPRDDISPIRDVFAVFYRKAAWQLVPLPYIPDGEYDWRGNPALWDRALGDLNVQLERRSEH